MGNPLVDSQMSIQERFGAVDLGDWGPSVPAWAAWRIRYHVLLDASVASAIYSVALAKAVGKQSEGLQQVVSDIVDDWCPTRPWPWPWPRPHWTDYIQSLGRLGDTYSANSTLRHAVVELEKRLVERANAVGR